MHADEWAEAGRGESAVTARERERGGVAIEDAQAGAGSPIAADAVASSEDFRACDCTATVPLAMRERRPIECWLGHGRALNRHVEATLRDAQGVCKWLIMLTK